MEALFVAELCSWYGDGRVSWNTFGEQAQSSSAGSEPLAGSENCIGNSARTALCNVNRQRRFHSMSVQVWSGLNSVIPETTSPVAFPRSFWNVIPF